MHISACFSVFALASGIVSAGRSLQHVGMAPIDALRPARRAPPPQSNYVKRAASYNQHKYLNKNSAKFAVNGTGIPEVHFDVGESYAGLLPISSAQNESSELYFWFFPSVNPEADGEILIWLNGGPGCSSLEGLLQENGPFSWQYGTFAPVPNPYSWTNLTNVVWIEQPVGAGFTQGTPTARDEKDVAAQFLGFWKNFLELFGMKNRKIYITGESYAGYYVSYIAEAMLDKKDKTYYDLEGTMIYDPSTTFNAILQQVPAVQFADYHRNLLPFNDSFTEYIHNMSDSCGYTKYIEKYLTFPPPGPFPTKLPGTDTNNSLLSSCDVFSDIFYAASEINPCFDIYQVATTCPILWDVLGFPGSFGYLPVGASTYFDRADVKKAINAPDVKWMECTDINVFVGQGDLSPPPGTTGGPLASVIERSNRTIIGHGALDMIFIANGTALMIQNMTWGGNQGFQKKPTEPFYVPRHDDPNPSTFTGSGVFGTTHTERGLTWVSIDLSGHMVPQYAPSAAYRMLEFLLGRVDSLSSTKAFTTNPYPQPSGPLGGGTAPPL